MGLLGLPGGGRWLFCLSEGADETQPSDPGINEPWTSPQETGAEEEGMRFLEEGNGQNSPRERLGSGNGGLGSGALIALLVRRV